MSKRWDVEADCAFDDVSEKLLAVGALTDFEPLPEPHERHRWHFPQLTPEQLDTLAADARGAVVDLNSRLREMARVQRDNERLRALISEAMKQKFMTNPCPWCRMPLDSIDDEHAADCPACTPGGEVR